MVPLCEFAREYRQNLYIGIFEGALQDENMKNFWKFDSLGMDDNDTIRYFKKLSYRNR